MNYRILPLASEFQRRVRSTGTDDLGQPVQRFVSTEGGEPLRDVLRRAHPGEELLAASYCPFAQPGPFKEYGPVYLLANESTESSRAAALPVTGDATDRYFSDSLVLRAYDESGAIRAARHVEAEKAETAIGELLEARETRFVDARFPTYGCYALRIVRTT